jgi:hypothetical protein
MKPLSLPLAAACLILSVNPARAGELSDEVVAKTLAVNGVTHVVRKKVRAGKSYDDLEYRDGLGQALVIVRLGTPQQYDGWKQSSGPDVEPVKGAGSDAFRYKPSRGVCARSATSAACVTPDFFLKTPKISNDQLESLVKAAL